MTENSPNNLFSLDPWSASSLLQKSIRRGDTEFARRAARLLHGYRGTAIFKRLLHIAIEDVGIANIALVSEIASVAADKALRNILGPDIGLVEDICDRLASSPKDRSADYLDSMARWSAIAPSAYEREAEVGRLISDAAQLLRQCTIVRNNRSTICEDAVHEFLDSEWLTYGPPLTNIIAQAAKCRAHPFTLILLPLWSAFAVEDLEVSVTAQTLAEPDWLNGIPLHTFDKHTAIGKAAISRFARENPDMSRVLSHWVAAPQRIQVAEIAAFYADAMPVTQRLRWSMGEALEEFGCEADMQIAGCASEGVQQVLAAARENLDGLNAVRRSCLRGTKK